MVKSWYSITKTTTRSNSILKEQSKDLKIVTEALEGQYATVDFVSWNPETGVGVFARYPERNEILPEINEQLIVEFYNR